MSRTELFMFKSFYPTLFLLLSCSSAATITRLTRDRQPLKDGDTLVSDVIGGGRFTLGFFSPPSPISQRYLGIWYNDDPQSGRSVIWVANRDRPIPDRTGSLTISADWNLILSDGNGSSIWSTRATITAPPSVAVLSTTGNLLLSGDSETSHWWQSFDVPTDTFSPGMKVLVDASVGPVVNAFRSWKSPEDPSPGKFTMGIDPQGAPQIVIWENLERRWRSGMWNGLSFTGMNATANYLYGFKLSREDGDGRVYFSYVPSDPEDSVRFRVDWDGRLEQLQWNRTQNLWDVTDRQPSGNCQRYNLCGKFGVCDESEGRPKCKCMDGFRPVNLEEWSRGRWSRGCERNESLRCQSVDDDGGDEGGTNEDKFIKLQCGKLPDFANLRSFRSLESCRRACLTECECHGYAMLSGIGCVLWSVDMVDIVHFNGSNHVLYIRMANSEPGGSRISSRSRNSKRVSKGVIAAIVVGGVVGLAAAALMLCCKIRRKRLKADSEMPLNDATKNNSAYWTAELTEGSDINHIDTPLFSFGLVALATDEFSMENKLGEGGFGPVYKGRLLGGEEIAVKRLSKISGQGLEEFKNEISLIAKLQHRNLVRLLGYCVHDEEKMLIYEYMPNKSLDFFLFNPAKQASLSWTKRLAIIEGIARGLLYLHRDSRLRVIHRDLKASNVLLDEEMNPKISDFGMARIFGGNQNEANTNRVVGTYGYMSPEYAMEGLFSVKSDVYSFGILVLEIVSGRKNTSFRFSNHVSLIAYAWELWSQGRAIEVVDPSIRDLRTQDEMLRCIQVGMLCVQGDPVHRPTMAEVVLMMERDSQSLPLPRQPTFTSSTRRGSVFRDVDSQGQVSVSNGLTVTMVVGR